MQLVCNCIPHPSRALADTRQTGKLSKEQFALAMYFIQQKVSKGIDPPHVLSPDMMPPSERGAPIPVSAQAPLFPFFLPATRRWCWCPKTPHAPKSSFSQAMFWGWEWGGDGSGGDPLTGPPGVSTGQWLVLCSPDFCTLLAPCDFEVLILGQFKCSRVRGVHWCKRAG